MKPFTLTAAAFTLSASAAMAGGMSDPVAEPAMTPAVVEQETASSAQGIIVPLLLLLVVAAVASN